jgi:hypothetical protein
LNLKPGMKLLLLVCSYSLLMIRLCTDYHLDEYPGTGGKVCWWVVVVGGGNS